MKMLHELSRRVPASVRRLGRPVKKAVELWRNYRCGLWILSGRERHSGYPLVVAYAGTDYSKSYFAGKIFAQDFEEQNLGRRWVFRALKGALLRRADISLFACEVPTPIENVFKPEAFATIPIWIRMEAKLSADSRVWSSKRFLLTQKRVKKDRLTVQVSRDLEPFNHFYRDTYLPYIRARHEGAAVTDSAELAALKFTEGDCELLLVRQDGELLGGIVISMRDGVERFWWLAGSLSERGKMGSLTDVLYYFAILRGRDAGCSLLNMGHCHAFLSDGLLWYKREWGGVLLNERGIYDGQIALQVLNAPSALKSFLRHNPFVGTDKNGRFNIHCFTDGTSEGEDEVKRWNSRYCNPGRIGIRVFNTVPELQVRPDKERELEPALF
ncbi:MAG: hypothetical protein WCL08_06165 [Verrucomicrobiota bacterium]